MVNSGEFVIAAAVVVEKLERRSAVGAKKDSRRPRMSELCVCGVGVGGGMRRRFANGVIDRSIERRTEDRNIALAFDTYLLTQWPRGGSKTPMIENNCEDQTPQQRQQPALQHINVKMRLR